MNPPVASQWVAHVGPQPQRIDQAGVGAASFQSSRLSTEALCVQLSNAALSVPDRSTGWPVSEQGSTRIWYQSFTNCSPTTSNCQALNSLNDTMKIMCRRKGLAFNSSCRFISCSALRKTTWRQQLKPPWQLQDFQTYPGFSWYTRNWETVTPNNVSRLSYQASRCSVCHS